MSAQHVFPGSLAVLRDEFPSIWLRDNPTDTAARDEMRVFGGILLVLEVVPDKRWEDDPSIRVLAPGCVFGWTFLTRLRLLNGAEEYVSAPRLRHRFDSGGMGQDEQL